MRELTKVMLAGCYVCLFARFCCFFCLLVGLIVNLSVSFICLLVGLIVNLSVSFICLFVSLLVG